MFNKQIFLGLVLGSVVSTSVLAANHTVSLGYADSSVSQSEGIEDFKGVNLQYRYETQSPWGAVVSASYLKADFTIPAEDGREDFDGKYFSLLAGPAYRFNEYVSAYALLGFSHLKVDYEESTFDNSYYHSSKASETGVAYGVGLAINPVENITLNIGYEGVSVKSDGDNVKLNGYNIGVGYRF